MDRTSELLRIAEVHAEVSRIPIQLKREETIPLTSFLRQAGIVWVNLEANRDLLTRLDRLAQQKEFSNDPSRGLVETSSEIELRMKNVKESLTVLQSLASHEKETGHAGQHFRLIVESLRRIVTEQGATFKDALRTHARAVEERQRRVAVYSGAATSSVPTTTPTNSSNGNKSSNPFGHIELQSAASATAAMGAEAVTQLEANSRHALFSGSDDLLASVGAAATLSRRRGGAPTSSNTGLPTPYGVSTSNDLSTDKGLRMRKPVQNDSTYSDSPFQSGAGWAALAIPPPIEQTIGTDGNPRSTGIVHRGSASGNPVFQPRAPMSYAAVNGPADDKKHDSPAGSSSGHFSNLMSGRKPIAVLEHRRNMAQQVESRMAQLGDMFLQLGTLVAEQGETLARIEDDVEAGLTNTLEGYASLQKVEELTRVWT